MNDKPKAAETQIGTVMGVVPRCPICGNQTWGKVVPPDLQEGETFQEIVAALKGQQLIGMAATTFMCNTCGFIRQHNTGLYKP